MTAFERTIDSPNPLSPSLTVAASPEQLRVLRGFARTTAQRALSEDRLADLVLAVDEAASTLLNHTLPASTLTCTVNADPRHGLRVRISATPSTPIDTSAMTFGWFVLRRLVDDVALEQVPCTVGQNVTVTIILCTALEADSEPPSVKDRDGHAEITLLLDDDPAT